MSDDDWENGYARAMGVFMSGVSITVTDPYGGRIVDDNLLLLFNASDQSLEWLLPEARFGRRWRIDLDTSDVRCGWSRTVNVNATAQLVAADRSMVVMHALAPPKRASMRTRSAHPTAQPAPPSE